MIRAACRRCLAEDGVELRVLWPNGRGMRIATPLCDDCNTLVQGPDCVDLEGNLA